MDTTFAALLCSLLFLGAAAWRWRSGAAPTLAGPQWLVLLAVLAAAVALDSALNATQGLQLGLGPMLATFAWLIVLVHLPLRQRMQLQPLDLPIWVGAGLLIPAGLLLPTDSVPHSTQLTLALRLHILLSLLAWATLTIATLQSGACALQSHRLRAHRQPIWPTPLLRMEAHLFRLIGIGWLLLVSAIATGFLFVDDFFAQHLVHKVAFTVLAAVLFGTLLVGQALRGWRGDQALRWVWAAWVTLFVGYAGVKWILEDLLQRSWS